MRRMLLQMIKIKYTFIFIIWAAFIACSLSAFTFGGLSAVYLVAMAIPWSIAFATIQESIPGLSSVVATLIIAGFAFLNCLFVSKLILKKRHTD